MRPLLIGGERIDTKATSKVINPWNGDVLDEVCLADRDLLDRTATAAHDAFARTRKQPPHERAELLGRIAAGITAQRKDFAQTIVAEAGKPITYARAEVDRAIINFTAFAEEARRLGGQLLNAGAFAPGAGHVSVIRRFPVGVVYGMTPFNFPLNLVAHKLAPALACGAPIILKPSPRTPLSTLKLAELAIDCGAVAGQVNVIHCGNDLATHLIGDARVHVVSFTGSAAVGKAIAKQAVGKKLTLELGGNAAVIVHSDADLEAAANSIVSGAFGYAGQSCISVQRVIVQRDVYASMRNLLIARIRAHVHTGDPSRDDVINGPMIESGAQNRVVASFRSAVAAGATILTGGAAEGPCVQPTLLENVPTSHELWAEEAFAPVAVLAGYETFDDAIRMANDSHYGLQAGVFTRDIGRTFAAFESLDVGGVMINQPPTFRLDNLPYGGVKDSGVGREGAGWAIEEMTEPRVMIIRP